MIDFANLKENSVNRPDNVWTVFGSPQNFNSLPVEHKDQIFFLNKEASQLVYNFYSTSKLVTGPEWEPFKEGSFKEQKHFKITIDNKATKKWLFKCGIPFNKFVFLLAQSHEMAIFLTWKMVVKYSEKVFWGGEAVVFDETGNWCLWYYHEDELFFGRDNLYDPEEGYREVEELDKLKKQFPKMRHPFKYN